MAQLNKNKSKKKRKKSNHQTSFIQRSSKRKDAILNPLPIWSTCGALVVETRSQRGGINTLNLTVPDGAKHFD